MALEINAQYVKFVQFAQQQDDAVNSKVIARVSGEDGALDGRTITAATNDKVAPWTRRSQVKKDANNILSRLNGSICEECKKLAGPDIESSQFFKDLNRNETVKLPGNQMLDNHSLDGARDQLASFVTNGAKTTYASLGDVEKGKVRVLMAILNQKTVINVLLSGKPLALDPDGRAAQIQYGVAGERRWEFSVAFKQDGTLTVTCKSDIDNLANMIIPGENGEEDYFAEDINPATKIETAFNVEIAADEFSHLASLDYSKCDPEAIDRMIADPNVKDPHTKYGQALGEKFAFKTDDFNSKVKCTSSWKITVA